MQISIIVYNFVTVPNDPNVMERIEKLFPRYDDAGKAMILKAFLIAEEALKDHTRSNGAPFLEHPLAVARIACDEIGLSAECIAAVFLHEAMRFFPETAIPKGIFGQDVMTMVDGLNKISTIKPKDTKLEAENYKRLIVSYSKDPRVTVLKIADRVVLTEIMGSREINTYNIYSKDLCEKIDNSVWFESFDEIAEYAKKFPEEYKEYQKQVVKNAAALADALIKEGFEMELFPREVDVTPTAAVLLGVRIPAQCEGSPAYSILSEEL